MSGALHEARILAEGLVVDAGRMRANIDQTRGLLFADAAAGRLTGKLGREAAHRLVEHAAAKVRATGASLAEVLAADQSVRDANVDLTDAFDLGPSVAAAARWVDPARHHSATVRARLTPQNYDQP